MSPDDPGAPGGNINGVGVFVVSVIDVRDVPVSALLLDRDIDDEPNDELVFDAVVMVDFGDRVVVNVKKLGNPVDTSPDRELPVKDDPDFEDIEDLLIELIDDREGLPDNDSGEDEILIRDLDEPGVLVPRRNGDAP